MNTEHMVGMVAHEFSRRLCNALTVEQTLEVIDRNKVETNASVCHSHDFCDANVLMENAMRAVSAENLEDYEQIWHRAWGQAKRDGFYFGERASTGADDKFAKWYDALPDHYKSPHFERLFRSAFNANAQPSAGRADQCPSCGGYNVEGGSIDVEAEEAAQACYCSDCGASWVVGFRVSEIMGIRGGRREVQSG